MARWLKLNLEAVTDRIPDRYEQIDSEAGILLSGIVPDSICDGPGLRLVFFTQGCPHRCPGCHNPETHGIGGGTLYRTDDLIAMLDRPLLQGVTFSGGEPFAQRAALIPLAEAAKERELNTIVYTGYTVEQLERWSAEDSDIARFLGLMDAVIDGPYVAALRDPELRWRGSSNQRVIALSATGEKLFGNDALSRRLNHSRAV